MKIRNLLFGVLALTAFFACQPDAEPVVKPVLELSTEKFVFGSVSDMKVLNITANNAWTISADVDWLDFSATSGEASEEKQSVNVYSEDNPAFEERTGKITVTAGGLTKEVAVTQKATEFVAELTLSVSELTAVAAGEELSFNVTSNVAWTASSESEWVTIAPANGEASETAAAVTVTVAANEANEARTAVITVAGQDVEETITLVQEAKPLEAEEMEGDGSEANPYLIKTASHMLSVRDVATVDATTYFRLENDIDMTPVKNWVPVNWDGTFSRQIHFDGNNKTISNFAPATWNYLAEPEEGSESTELVETNSGYHSLFGVLYGSLKNLNITNVTITGSNSCGVIGGYVGTENKSAIVENVTITNASVTNSGERTGGVCGTAYDATFNNVSFQGSVTSAKNDLGGFVGKTLGEVSFTGCSVKAVVTSNATEKNRCGGFIGWNTTKTTTITNCHVLEGSSVSAPNGVTNVAGFIGYGDGDKQDEVALNTVLTITGCSAKANVSAPNAPQVSGFLGQVGYESTVTISDSYAECNLESVKNYCGGILGRIDNGTVVITGCHYSGTMGGRAGAGGILGGIEGGSVTISKCYATGSMSPSSNNHGGILGLSNATSVIENCWSNMAITVPAGSQHTAGILGTGQGVKAIVKNCYALGTINGSRGVGGIVGHIKTKDSEVSGCIAWNAEIKTNRAAGNWATGAIIGAVHADGKGTYADCYRRYDMVLTDVAMTLVDQENITDGRPPYPDYAPADNTQNAYHGKAAAEDATISSVATTLGWSTDVWDLSGDVPVLK